MALSYKLRNKRVNLEAIIQTSSYIGWSVANCSYSTVRISSAGKEGNAGDKGDVGLIPGLGRSSAEENDNPLQCSCLKNSIDRGAWWATVHGVARTQSDMTKQQKQPNWPKHNTQHLSLQHLISLSITLRIIFSLHY